MNCVPDKHISDGLCCQQASQSLNLASVKCQPGSWLASVVLLMVMMMMTTLLPTQLWRRSSDRNLLPLLTARCSSHHCWLAIASWQPNGCDGHVAFLHGTMSVWNLPQRRPAWRLLVNRL